MKCFLCSQEIDEKRNFPTAKGPNGQIIEDVVGRMLLAQELSTWVQVTLTAQVQGGCKTIFSGHICPKHDLANLGIGQIEPREPEKGKRS